MTRSRFSALFSGPNRLTLWALVSRHDEPRTSDPQYEQLRRNNRLYSRILELQTNCK